MNWIYPLRRIIPLAMLVFSLLFAATLFTLETRRATKAAVEQQELLAAHNGYQLATLLRDEFSRNDWAEAARHLQTAVTLPDLRRAYLLDDKRQIRLTTDYRLKGRSLQSLALRPDPYTLERVSQSLTGEILRARYNLLWAIFPIELPFEQAEELRQPVGFIVLEIDTAFILAKARREALENTLFLFAGSLLIGALFWFYLDRFLVRRIGRLSADVQRWRQQHVDIPVLSGRDEVAELSRHFSIVAKQFGEQYGQLRGLFDQSFQNIFIVSRSGVLVDANELALHLVNGTLNDFRGQKLWETPWWSHDAELKKQLREDLQAVAAGQQIMRRITHHDSYGDPYVFNYSFRPVRSRGSNEVEWLLAEGRDVTQLFEVEYSKQRLGSFFATLSHTNSAIVRAENEAELLPKICQIIVDQSEISGAWIGFVHGNKTTLEPVAVAHVDTAYLDEIEIGLGAGSVQRYGPAARAIREKRTVVYNDFVEEYAGWADESILTLAKEHGIAAAAALPLYRKGKLQGCLTLYGAEKGVFSEDLVTLLEELAADISFALKSFADRDELQLSGKVFDSAHESIVVADSHYRIVSVNRAFLEFTGRTEEEVLGKTLDVLRPEQHEPGYYRRMWEVVENSGYWQGEVLMRSRSGEPVPTIFSVSAVTSDDGRIVNYVCVATDISEHREAEERVRYLAYNDPLTGLPNRMLLYDRGDQALKAAEKQSQEVAVIFLDLDRFKHINESLGHFLGDKLLTMVAHRLRQALDERDTLGRLGGDEFLLMLGDADANRAAHVAQALLEEFERPFQVDGQSLTITASAGIAMFPRDGESFEELHQHADVAMYKAKELGRNRYHFFTSELNSEATERLVLENSLRDALELRQISAHYQPQIDLATGQVCGVEALLRWQHPKLGMISPAQFIPIAEEAGLINRIGEWVVVEACREAMRWQRKGLPAVVMAVNVSAKQFVGGDIVQVVERALEETGLAADLLEIEITESVFAHDLDTTLEAMKKLSDMGVHVAVDDFGTGYSSLSYLKRFPVNKLKIDRSFVNDIETDEDDRELAAGIINLGHSLEMTVIAEGIETDGQMKLLQAMNCDIGQGYLFSKPLPADELVEFLEQRQSETT